MLRCRSISSRSFRSAVLSQRKQTTSFWKELTESSSWLRAENIVGFISHTLKVGDGFISKIFTKNHSARVHQKAVFFVPFGCQAFGAWDVLSEPGPIYAPSLWIERPPSATHFETMSPWLLFRNYFSVTPRKIWGSPPSPDFSSLQWHQSGLQLKIYKIYSLEKMSTL